MSRPAWAAAGLAAAVGGCIIPVVSDPGPVVVEFVNQTAFDIRPNYYVSSAATDAAGLFIAENLHTSFINRSFPELRPGETASTSHECSASGSLGVNQPVLFDAATLDVTTSEDQIFLVRDGGFSCGGTIRFVYFTEGEAFRVRVEYP